MTALACDPFCYVYVVLPSKLAGLANTASLQKPTSVCIYCVLLLSAIIFTPNVYLRGFNSVCFDDRWVTMSSAIQPQQFKKSL